MSWPKVRLGLAVVLFVSWIGWLAWQTREVRSVVVSRSQLAVADCLVVAEVGPDRKTATVSEIIATLSEAGAPAKDSELVLPALEEARGFVGEGTYLLVLSQGTAGYRLTPIPSSSGFEAERRPWVYPWTETVRRQVNNLIDPEL